MKKNYSMEKNLHPFQMYDYRCECGSCTKTIAIPMAWAFDIAVVDTVFLISPDCLGNLKTTDRIIFETEKFFLVKEEV